MGWGLARRFYQRSWAGAATRPAPETKENEITALLNELIPHQRGAQEALVGEMVSQAQREAYAGVGSEQDAKKAETSRQFRQTLSRLQVPQAGKGSARPKQNTKETNTQKKPNAGSTVAQNAKPQRAGAKTPQQTLTQHLLELRK